MEQIRLRAFRAIDELHTCQKYFQGHSDVLKIFGITKITSANTDWFFNPNVFVIVAESIASGKLVGGIRVQVAGGTQPLPVEDAIKELDDRILPLVHKFAAKGTGELCGLWNSREVAGMGISVILTRAGISISSQLGMKTFFGICANLTLNMFQNVGYEIERSLGDNGTFYYPKEDLLANALMIKNAETLEKANPIDREIIFNLRKNPSQQKIEIGPKGEIDIIYELFFPKFDSMKLKSK
jgi:hypothetical protein